jgi:hypothetical protein
LIDHRLPFHRTATDLGTPSKSAKTPIATHDVVETHETPLSELELHIVGFGLHQTDQPEAAALATDGPTKSTTNIPTT